MGAVCLAIQSAIVIAFLGIIAQALTSELRAMLARRRAKPGVTLATVAQRAPLDHPADLSSAIERDDARWN
jgi:hypothetical protein